MSYLLINPNDHAIEYGPADVYYVIDHLSINNGAEILDTVRNSNPSSLFAFESYLFLEGYENSSVFTGEFLLDTVIEYVTTFPHYTLDLDNKSLAFNCLMRNFRFSRIWTSCWLMNHHYRRTKFAYSQPWDLNADLVNYVNSSKLEKNINLRTEILPSNWHEHGAKNPENYLSGTKHSIIFKEALKKSIFDPAVFSIVMEPIHSELGCMLTEKYINAIYGGTIPIVDGYMTYDVLEKLGFDTFSDIINMSSQRVQDPTLRVIEMLENNKHLFEEDYYLRVMDDPSIRERLMKNLDLIRNVDRLFNNIMSLNLPQNIARYRAACAHHQFKFHLFNGLLSKNN